MKLVLEGSLSEIRNEMREFLGYGDADVIATAEAMLPPPPAQATAGKPEAPAAPKRERKAKETAAVTPVATAPEQPAPAKDEQGPAAPAVTGQAATTVATVVTTPAPAPAAAVSAVPTYPAKTLDEVRAAIADLVTAKGVPVAKALLARFGVGRAQDVLPDRFGEIEAKARAAIAGTFDPEAA